MKKTMKIYIAGPYSAPTEIERLGNVAVAMAVGLKVFKKGHIPFIPHLTHYVDLFAKANGISMAYEEYMKWDDVWLKSCEAILVIAESPGVRVEMESAKKMGLQFFGSVEQVPYVKPEIPKWAGMKLIIIPRKGDDESETIEIQSIQHGKQIVNARYKALDKDDPLRVTMTAVMMHPDGTLCAPFETGSWH